MKRAKGTNVSNSRLAQAILDANLSLDPIPTDLTSVLSQLRANKADLQHLQCDHRQLRQSHLESLAEARALQHQPHLVNHPGKLHQNTLAQLKGLIKRERKRNMYRKIGYRFNRSTSNTITKLDIPDSSVIHPTFGDPKKPKTWTGPWKIMTNPKEIAKVIISMNESQYDQAHDTPFGSGPLADSIGR